MISFMVVNDNSRRRKIFIMNNETNNSDSGIKCVILNDEKEIHLNDKNDDIFLSIVSDGKILTTTPILYPSRGYADGALFLSPAQTYLMFAYYSGQSEEAFTLFRIANNKLEIVFESPYLGGEIASYCFSKDEKILIQGLPSMCDEWWQPWLDGDAEKDEKGNLFFDFGVINILDIEKGAMSKHIIRIYPMSDWQPIKESYNPFMSPEIINANVLKISMPWGDEMLGFPLENTICFWINR